MTTNSPIPPTMEEPLRDELRALAEKNPGKWFDVSYRLQFHNGHFYFDALSATASDCPNADPLVKHLQQQVERLREALGFYADFKIELRTGTSTRIAEAFDITEVAKQALADNMDQITGE